MVFAVLDYVKINAIYTPQNKNDFDYINELCSIKCLYALYEVSLSKSFENKNVLIEDLEFSKLLYSALKYQPIIAITRKVISRLVVQERFDYYNKELFLRIYKRVLCELWNKQRHFPYVLSRYSGEGNVEPAKHGYYWIIEYGDNSIGWIDDNYYIDYDICTQDFCRFENLDSITLTAIEKYNVTLYDDLLQTLKNNRLIKE